MSDWNYTETKPEFHFKVILEDTEMRTEQVYKESSNPNSEHDLDFPSLSTKFDAIVTALKSLGHTEEAIKEEMQDYLEWEEGKVWAIVRRLEEEIYGCIDLIENNEDAALYNVVEWISGRLQTAKKILEEAN